MGVMQNLAPLFCMIATPFVFGGFVICYLFLLSLIETLLGLDKTIIKQNACEAPRSPCGKYEQNSFVDAIIWADVGNDL